MKRRPRGDAAVMAGRIEPTDSLDDFPTPPWATRALFDIVFRAMNIDLCRATVMEPACGRGLMAFVIEEYAARCIASDVHDYGYPGAQIGSFVGEGPDVARTPENLDAVISNPPFRLALAFIKRALRIAPTSAFLLPTRWVEGERRYRDIIADNPPSLIAYFAERVPMHKGRWDPDGSTATSYSWFVWLRSGERFPPLWIPPGQRQRLHRPTDLKRAHDLGALGDIEGVML